MLEVAGPRSIFLLAQNRLLREALAKILEKKSDLKVVASSAFSLDAITEIASSQPSVLLMDSLTSEFSYLDFVRQVRDCTPETKIVLIGMDADEQPFLQAVREDSNLEMDLLWLATKVGSPAQRRYALERALRINPHSVLAKRGLAQVRRRPLQPLDLR